MFTLVRTDNFDTEVLEGGTPVLLAYVRQDHMFKEQTEVLERVARTYHGGVKVCLLDEDSVGSFREKCHIKGAPTYLIFDAGKKMGRMLGLADGESLTGFLVRTLPHFEKVAVSLNKRQERNGNFTVSPVPWAREGMGSE